MRNNSKSRKNKYINFRVPKESEEVLKKNRISSPSSIKERSIDIPISKKHSNCTC
jgi:hypothetical protein